MKPACRAIKFMTYKLMLAISLQGPELEKSWDEEVQDLQDKVISSVESGDVGPMATQLAQAATEVADVARASLASTDEHEGPDFSPKAHQEGQFLKHLL